MSGADELDELSSELEQLAQQDARIHEDALSVIEHQLAESLEEPEGSD